MIVYRSELCGCNSVHAYSVSEWCGGRSLPTWLRNVRRMYGRPARRSSRTGRQSCTLRRRYIPPFKPTLTTTHCPHPLSPALGLSAIAALHTATFVLFCSVVDPLRCAAVVMSTLSDSEAEDVELFELAELELEDAQYGDSEDGGRRAAGGIEAAGRANVDLRMERLPPGQSCQCPAITCNHSTAQHSTAQPTAAILDT